MENYIALGAALITFFILFIYEVYRSRRMAAMTKEPFTAYPNSVGTFDSAMNTVNEKARALKQKTLAFFGGKEAYDHVGDPMKTFNRSTFNGSQLPANDFAKPQTTLIEPYQFTRLGDGSLKQCPPVYEQFDPNVDPMGMNPRTYVNEMNWNTQRTSAKLANQRDAMLPVVSEDVTPYNIDVADPIAYSFLVHAPRVIVKDRQAMMADPFRGDIPLSINPDVPVVERPQYGRSSLRYDTLFSDGYAKLQAKYNKSMTQMNAPIHVAQEGVNM